MKLATIILKNKGDHIMYVLTEEDKNILVNYREFLKGEVSKAEDEQVRMILGKSVDLLSGEITAETLQNYLQVQVKKGANKTVELSENTKQKINEIRIAAKQYGVMEVVKRFKQANNQ